MREERRIITVLFADLVGFTARAESLDPEEVGAFLTPFYTRLGAEIEHHGGIVERFIGDAVMGLFGATVAHEDDPERGVRTALAIRDWIATDVDDLQVRVAVNTGQALVMLGAGAEGRYVVTVGDVVNTASRMQDLAPVNGVLVGEATYEATRHAIDYREVEPITVKGKAQPVPVWEALEARTQPGVRVWEGGATPFIGRELELNALLAALVRAREQTSVELVTLIGAPGIGKSRLLAEVRDVVAAEPDPVTWLQGRCLPYGEGVSFWALGEMVKAEAGILESDAAEHAGQKLARSVTALIPDPDEARWIAGRLGTLVGAGDEEPAGDDRKEETFAAWRHYLAALAGRNPLVLAFEDLHWADPGLLDFVDALAREVTGVPLLVLSTSRPELLERRPGWGSGRPNALTLPITPLDDDITAELIRSLLGATPVSEAVHMALLAHAGGNPLYAEQFARMRLERGDSDPEALPDTVQGIIAARLDALPEEEKRMLQDAAVIGTVFWLGAAEVVGRTERAHANSLLRSLDRKEFVERADSSAVENETEYSFPHGLLRDVAYAQIPRAGRVEKHRLAAEWLESIGRPDDHAELLAHHYLRALEYAQAAKMDSPVPAERATRALRRAGERAHGLGAYAASARFYAAALECCPAPGAERADLLLRQGHALFLAEGSGDESLTGALAAFQAAGDVEGAADTARALSRSHWYRGERDDAYSYVDQAVGLLVDRPASPAKARTLVARAALHMVNGEGANALPLARDGLAISEELGLDAVRARALNIIGLSRVQLGEIDGIGDLKESVAIARAANAFDQLHTAYENLRTAYLILGRLDAASKTLAEQAESVGLRGKAHDIAWLRFNEAEEAYVQGRWDEALAKADAFMAQVEGGLSHYLDGSARARRAVMRLGRGDLAGAESDTGLAVETARRAKDAQLVGPALCARAMVALAAERPAEANELSSEVAALARVSLYALLDWSTDFAWVMRELERRDELVHLLAAIPAQTAWLKIARKIATGDLVRAAELLGQIGHLSGEAYARLRAGELLREAGSSAEADGQLARAVAFYRDVGAEAYEARARLSLRSAPAEIAGRRDRHRP